MEKHSRSGRGSRSVARLLFALAGTLAAALMIGWSVERIRGEVRANRQAQLESLLQYRAGSLRRLISDMRQDVLALAALPPVRAIAESGANPGADPDAEQSLARSKDRLTQAFIGYASARPDLRQIRYIGVADVGRELVRVGRGPQGLTVTPPEQLQQKGDRGYFKATLALKSGQAYVSDLDLNQEHGVVEVPHVPTLRFATPVTGADGATFGMIVVNIDAKAALAQIAAGLPDGVQAYVTNGRGDYLLNPDPSRDFGFDLGQVRRWSDDFNVPQNAGLPAAGLIDARRDGEVAHLVSQTIPYDPGDPSRRFNVALVMDDAPMAAAVGRAVRNVVAETLLLLALIGGATYLYWRERERAAVEQARSAAIVTSSADAIIGKSLEGVVTDWNPAAAKIFGYSAEQAVGHTLQSLIVPPELVDEEQSILARIARGEAVPHFETVRLRRDGSRLDVAVTVSPIRNAYGEIVGASKTARDITSQKKSQEALRRVQVQMRMFIQQAPTCIAMFDRQMNYLACSDLWRKQYGRGHADLIGLNHYAVHPDLPEIWRDLHRKGLKGITNRSDEDLWIHPDGTREWLRWVIQPWNDEDGGIGGIIITAEDISERKRAEVELRIAAVAFQSREGMIVTDANGVILRANTAFCEAKGYGSREVIGATPAMWKSDRHDPVFYRRMWEAIGREGRWEGQIWNRRKDGGIYPEWLSISRVCDAAGQVTHYVGTFSDIRDPKAAERKILDLAFYDQLTGLPNRRLMLDRLQQALAGSVRTRQRGAVLLFDLDHFKSINDTRGHAAGDLLLVDIAQRVRAMLRQTDTAARLGGDEFVVLLENLSTDAVTAATLAEGIAEKLRASIRQSAVFPGERIDISCSIGVAMFGAEAAQLDALLKQADIALYQAKGAGRNTARFFNADMQAAVDARAELEAGLRRALAQNEFELHYQPQVDINGRVLGVEALLRWHPPGREPLAPATFIEVAEETGLIVPIGYWVLETACRQAKAWEGKDALRELVVAVNVSARQFRQIDFIDQISRILLQTGANPNRLRFELTESLLLHEVDKVVHVMRQLNSLGICCSIDDFGTGYSSLAYLKRLPLAELKIAHNFVHHIDHNAEDRAIVKAVMSLGQSLNLPVTAEGVETQAQRRILIDMGCHAYQGYLFGRPGPACNIEEMVGTEVEA